MVDWIIEEIAVWLSKTATQVMDALSGIFLNTLGTDMTVMESYFPFVSKAFTVMQYIAWAILFIITVWQLFRSFGGSLTEAENPTSLVIRSVLFAVLIGFAKPIFLYVLDIARAPYTALMDIEIGAETFTFYGIESVIKNALINFVSVISVVGVILTTVLMIALGWNYFKLLLEVVERYIVVGVLCYTSPLAYSMGASKTTSQVFKSWCRMIGSQLLLLVMNVWFLRAFNSAVGQYVASGGVLANGAGNVFLWLFCAIAFLKTAQKFDSYLSSLGLSVAQTGAGMGMELLVASRVLMGAGGRAFSAGSIIRGSGGAVTGTGGSFMTSFANKLKPNSYIRDSVTQGGSRMGTGGPLGFFGRMFGGIAAKNGATLSGESISSVAGQTPDVSGRIGGDIADRSLSSYMPHLGGKTLTGTQIAGGHIETNAVGADGKETSVHLYNADQFEKPNGPYSTVTASDGTSWYQTASGANAGAFYDTPTFTGTESESVLKETFPDMADGTSLRTLDSGVISASTPDGETKWYNSAYYDEPNAPHIVMKTSDGVDWYAMDAHAQAPNFESGTEALAYNQAQFQNFMPGYEQSVSSVDGSQRDYGHFEVRHGDGSGTAFYDTSQYAPPKGDYQVYEDRNGGQWYAMRGSAAVERRPVYENGSPVYGGDGNVKTVSTETVRYQTTPSRYQEPKTRDMTNVKAPNRKKA